MSERKQNQLHKKGCFFAGMLLLLFSLMLGYTSAHAQNSSGGSLFINVGDAQLKKSLLALPPFQYLGSPASSSTYMKVGKDLYSTVFNDLSVSSYFQFIPQEGFLEDTSKVGLKPKNAEANGFNFSSWQQIGTEFLIRAGYKMVGSKLTLEAYLYYVPKGEAVFGKVYEGTSSDVRKIAHRFSNDVVEKLTGKKGIFETKLVTVRNTQKGEKEIFIMDWDGQNATQITSHNTISFSPTWSRDGNKIAYSAFAYHKKTKTRNADLFMYDLKERKRWLVSYRPGTNSGVSFFPDMSRLILRISSTGVSDLYSMTLDGSSVKRLTNGPRGAMNVEPDISPDGSKVLFSSDRAGNPMVYVMNADGSGTPKRLTFAGKYNSEPTWSPDGTKIAFAGHDNGKFDIFLMNADGTNMSRLTSARKKDGTWSDNESPSFSPDGRHILFTSNRTGNYQLYIVNLDGTNERRITFDTYSYNSPMWSPYLD